MNNFGYSFPQCEKDWPLFDDVPEECKSIQQPSLVTSEDTDLSDDSDKILPSRHKRSRRFNFRKFPQSPGRDTSDGWRTIDRELGGPVLKDRTIPPLENRFSPENQWQLDPYEDVWSGSEEELELEIVNQFLMARSQVMSNDNSPGSPQLVLISGKQVHSSRSQCPMVSPAESLHSFQVSTSRFHNPVRQPHLAKASVGPTTTLEMNNYIRDDLHNNYDPNHLKTAKGELLDTGFEHTQVTQESGKDEEALQELQEDTRIQSQYSKDSQHTAGGAEGHCQSMLWEDPIAQTFVTVSNDSQFLTTGEPSMVTGSMPANLSAEGECKTDYTITVPEMYEYFYTDNGDKRNQTPLFLHLPSKYTDQNSCRRKEINLLTAIKTFVWQYLQVTKQEKSALVPVRTSNRSERAKVDTNSDPGLLDGALVRYSPVDRSQTMMESLVRRAFLVNLSAISAVRYFRRHVQSEDSKSLVLQDTIKRSLR